MAKKGYGFSDRFPHFGKILFLALVLSLGISVWSVQKAPTNTQQEAATTTCSISSNGGECYKYNCPTGYASISGTCGVIADSACCTSKVLAKPTNLKSYASYCKSGSPIVEYDIINFNWDPVKYAIRYTLYHRIYNSGNAYSTISLSGYSNTTYLLSNKYKNLNGRRIQWYVKAANDYGSNISSTYTTPYAYASCP